MRECISSELFFGVELFGVEVKYVASDFPYIYIERAVPKKYQSLSPNNKSYNISKLTSSLAPTASTSRPSTLHKQAPRTTNSKPSKYFDFDQRLTQSKMANVTLPPIAFAMPPPEEQKWILEDTSKNDFLGKIFTLKPRSERRLDPTRIEIPSGWIWGHMVTPTKFRDHVQSGGYKRAMVTIHSVNIAPYTSYLLREDSLTDELPDHEDYTARYPPRLVRADRAKSQDRSFQW